MDNKMVCPWWMGYLLANPVRRLFQNPEKIMAPYINKGDKILEIGPGMGFFSIPMASMTGEKGKVYCVDLQPKMLAVLEKRGKKAGAGNIIETRIATAQSLNISDIYGSLDFALLFAVVHEVPDQGMLFTEVYRALRPGGRMLISEPSGHVTREGFNRTVDIAQEKGFIRLEEPKIPGGVSALFSR
jgi:ubiquinone/menaquinone biosynthesis C-methylase UbiE